MTLDGTVTLDGDGGIFVRALNTGGSQASGDLVINGTLSMTDGGIGATDQVTIAAGGRVTSKVVSNSGGALEADNLDNLGTVEAQSGELRIAVASCTQISGTTLTGGPGRRSPMLT
jgi:hypothetical protein